ncbi:MAG: DUF1653 domain-containing protein [Lachnospiraceae bacterium]|nr:DUF1653 domain-containing protein [Lachnospiraceae bacterium]MCI5586990.1 DUF1653 domain-containing protein [Lachnospiraceae bacterium]
MTRNIPVAGEFYRHFKGNIYQIKSIATDSETGKKIVVYQAMYPPFGMWVRSLDMFMSETDHQKYPECNQQFRFEKVVFDSQGNVHGAENEKLPENVVIENVSEKIIGDSVEDISDEELKKIIINGQLEKIPEGQISEDEISQRGFMMILDAESYHEKYQLFEGLEKYLDERLLSNIAVSFDIVLEDGTEKEHYDTILANLQTWDRFEDRRMR